MNETGASAQVWIKSSRCDAQQCLEASISATSVQVRNNSRPHLQLRFSSASWQGLLRDVRQGRFDR